MNKPSRRTLYKTMEIIRRYTMGPNPVKIQILSDQQRNFRNLPGKGVNYEDEFYSVDLPIFSIHGNHDDPTRDGGSEMLAALDLLSVSNLVNYFGNHDEVNKVEVSPVLLQKGTTRVALYGMGSMRDERLNRMWQQKHVRFLRPEDSAKDEEDDSDDEEWFNIFVLHQNRDLGRGTKNCVHESMLPPFCDLVVWGHEHACEILPAESLVGTFRITQPGSSVATSLTAGEAIRKQCAILNIRGHQFKLEPIPLTMVRSFVTHDVLLSNYDNLDPEDPKIDDKISKLLEGELRMCIHNAREKTRELLEDARKEGNNATDDDSSLKYKLEKRDQVLVRIRVEHSGFSTLNNQRFGAKFVGQVANPTDILLFSKTRAKAVGVSGSKKGKAASDALKDAVVPEEARVSAVQDLCKEILESDDQQLELLKEKYLSQALVEFVDKGELKAIPDFVGETIEKQERNIRQRSRKGTKEEDDAEGEDGVTGEEEEPVQAGKRKRDPLSDGDDDDDALGKENKAKAARDRKTKEPQKKSSTNGRASKTSANTSRGSQLDSDDDDEVQVAESSQRGKRSNGWKSTAKSKASKGDSRRSSGDIRSFISSQSQSQKTANSRRAKRADSDDDDFHDDDDSVVEVKNVKRAAPRRRTAKGRVNYSIDDDGSDEEVLSDDMMDDSPPKKKPSRNAGASRSKRKATQDSSMDLDFDADWGSASTKTHK